MPLDSTLTDVDLGQLDSPTTNQLKSLGFNSSGQWGDPPIIPPKDPPSDRWGGSGGGTPGNINAFLASIGYGIVTVASYYVAAPKFMEASFSKTDRVLIGLEFAGVATASLVHGFRCVLTGNQAHSKPIRASQSHVVFAAAVTACLIAPNLDRLSRAGVNAVVGHTVLTEQTARPALPRITAKTNTTPILHL